MERAPMPKAFERILQMTFSIGERDRWCRRGLCKRYRLCIPPRHREHDGLYRCPADGDDEWLGRAEIGCKFLARIVKQQEAAYAAAGRSFPPLSPPPYDHLDLSRPLDLIALFAEVHEDFRPLLAGTQKRAAAPRAIPRRR